jgi:hypothetical protein
MRFAEHCGLFFKTAGVTSCSGDGLENRRGDICFGEASDIWCLFDTTGVSNIGEGKGVNREAIHGSGELLSLPCGLGVSATNVT